MEHIWSVLCQRSLIDNQTNNLSLIETVESVKFSAEEDIKAVPLDVVLVSMWWRNHPEQPESALYRISIVSPDGDILITSDTTTLNLSTAQRFRCLFRIQGMPFTKSGIYRVVGELQSESSEEWREVARTPLELVRNAP